MFYPGWIAIHITASIPITFVLSLDVEVAMEALVERLDSRLREWAPETAEQVRQRVAELIEWADHGALDLMRSRAVEQEVLDLVDSDDAPTG